MLFMGKMIIIGFGCCHGNLAVKIKLNRTKFILSVIGYLYIKYGLGCFLVWKKWHEIRVIHYKVLG